MRKPEEYRMIARWGRWLGSLRDYIENEQKKAAEAGAPVDAIFYNKTDKRWDTASELTPNHKFLRAVETGKLD